MIAVDYNTRASLIKYLWPVCQGSGRLPPNRTIFSRVFLCRLILTSPYLNCYVISLLLYLVSRSRQPLNLGAGKGCFAVIDLTNTAPTFNNQTFLFAHFLTIQANFWFHWRYSKSEITAPMTTDVFT